MYLRQRSTAWLGAALLALGAAGCGGGNASVYPVKGQITFEGKPMRGGGTIAFIPLSKQDGKAPGGEIAEDGTYVLSTYTSGDGSMTGEFRVVITQVVEQEPGASEDGQKVSKTTFAVPPADRIPAIYADPNNSPLTAKVEAKNPNELNFELKRQAGGEPPPSNRGAMRNLPPRDLVATSAR
jgi:hypothetical protein